MSWTDERVETLKKMWGEGQSASQIAKELGGVTRNAVIGKVHRLGLSNRAGSGATPAAPAAATPAAAKGTAPMTEPARPASPPRSPAPEAATETTAKAASSDDDDDDSDPPPMSAARRAIIPAGQPLPPQPSLNEISPEALAKVNEVEKTARKLTLMELTEKTCKWPVGDPATDNFWFCGLAVQQGKP